MNDYRLMVEPVRGERWRELVIQSAPALNYVANDLATLSEKQASYSQAIALPFCKENDEVFEFARMPDAYTNAPYRSIRCRLYCGGATLAGDGALLLLNRVTTAYECQILSGNATFYDLMSSAKFADYDFGSVPMTREACEAVSGAGYTFGVAEFVTGKGAQEAEAEMYLGRCKPFIPMSYVLGRIMQLTGYTLDASVPASDYEAAHTTLATLDFVAGGDPSDYKARGSLFVPYGGNPDTWAEAGATVLEDGSGALQALPYYPETPYNTVLQYTLPYNADVTVKIVAGSYGSNPARDGGRGFVAIVQNNAVVSSTPIYQGYDFTQEIRVAVPGDPTGQAGNYLRVFYDSYVPDQTPENAGMTIDVAFTPAGQSGGGGGDAEGQIIPINTNIGFETFFDYFKLFIQAFGLLVDVDEKTKTVRAVNLQDVYNRREETPVDWTPYTEEGAKPVVNFHATDYARRSVIAFDENGFYGTRDTFAFEVADETLEAEKFVLELSTESGADVYRLFIPAVGTLPIRDYFAEIPMYEQVATEDGGTTVEYNDTKKPHLVRLTTTNNFIAYKSDYYNVTFNGAEYPAFRHITASDVAGNYAAFVSYVLNKYFEVEEELRLPPEEVQNLDLLRPVYVGKYGKFFYVNKVANYIAGQKTKVTLISL